MTSQATCALSPHRASAANHATKNSAAYPSSANAHSAAATLTLTVYRGGIEKYLVAAQELVDKYGLPKYYTQRMDLIKEEITLMFDNKKPKQAKLFDFG